MYGCSGYWSSLPVLSQVECLPGYKRQTGQRELWCASNADDGGVWVDASAPQPSGRMFGLDGRPESLFQMV